MPPSRPDVIGKYSVERFIESGGMGDVYLARDPTLDRPVAIKFLREGFDSQEMRERFEREARSAGRLSHPNIVTIYEFGVVEGRPFIAMEFVRGEPLSKLIRRREPLGLVRKLELMEGLCAGLGHAHKAGIVHRDIKPANLMVDPDGGPLKILDFGIVRMAGSGLTSHGVLVGTVNYMSPEQISGRGTIDHRSDVFAVGAVLHELFTYQRAFPGEMTDVLYKIVHTQPASAASLDPSLDPGIVRAIDICLQKAPEHRYQDLAMLRRDLARIRQRLELEEQETYGHSVATMRGLRDVPSHPSHPSGGAPGTPPPLATPPPTPKPAVPQTSPSERARQQAVAAEQARRQREADEARLAREQAERERIARERAEKEQAEQARLEQIRQEHLRQERLRLERERAEAEQREREKIAREREETERARAEAAERARVAHEQAERARLEDARRAREQAERERVAAQQQAREEAERQAEARRQQRQRDLAQAQQAVAAGRFGEALDRLRPWTAEADGDKAFSRVWREAEAGAARLEAERREREAIAAQVAAAAEALAREDFSTASRLVQAILKAQPSHGGARTLERDIVRGVEVRARAVSTVERARGLFAGAPGEALELLERFSPAHALVDAALDELRNRHAAQERERLLRERRERLRANVDWTVAQAATLVRNRVVQISAAVLALVIVLGIWLASRPDPPAEVAETAVPTTTAPEPATEARREPARPGGVSEPSRPAVDPEAPASPDDGIDRRGQVPTPTVREIQRPAPESRPAATGLGNAPPAQPSTVAERVETPPPVLPPAEDRPATPANTNTRAEPPAAPPPAAPTPAQVATEEIRVWMAEYTAAYRRLDETRVRQMNPQSPLKANLVRTASVQFEGAQIIVEPDGRSAVLRAKARYEYSWKRAGGSPVSEAPINWRMSKVGNTWIANR